MKKLIAVIVIVLVIWGIAKLLGISFSLSVSPDKKESGSKKLHGRVAIEYIVGCPLPKTATDIHTDYWKVYEENTYWLVARLPKEDFNSLVEQLNLNRTVDLLKLWPEAFEWRPGSFNNNFQWKDHSFHKIWDLRNVANEDTYFRESSTDGSRVVIKYESGKLYFKKILK